MLDGQVYCRAGRDGRVHRVADLGIFRCKFVKSFVFRCPFLVHCPHQQAGKKPEERGVDPAATPPAGTAHPTVTGCSDTARAAGGIELAGTGNDG